MDKTLLQSLSGFSDALDSNKDWLVERLRQVFVSFGYRSLSTPTLERQEILLNKFGPEAQKLLYLFKDNGDRAVGLRYDLTVPLARFVAGCYQSLPLPFKRYEIGPVYRAEKPQKGRSRQFDQADVDIIGQSGLGAVKELLTVIKAVETTLDLTFTCQINDRRLIGAVLDSIEVPAKEQTILLQLLDKKDKIPTEKLRKELAELGLNDVQRRQINQVFLTDDTTLATLEPFLSDPTAIDDLKTLLEFGRTIKLNIVFTPAMVRGLDYYTGLIFECLAEGYDGGSVVGGGQYDSLIESLIGVKLPAVGISFGVDRLVGAIGDRIVNEPSLFVVNLPETEPEIRQWVTGLRTAGRNVELYPESSVELGLQIKYAAKRNYPSIIIPLAEEWRQGKVIEKNLADGTQKTVTLESIKHHV